MIEMADSTSSEETFTAASSLSGKGSALTCITCRLMFTTSKEQREHYKSDLHRFNLKRRVANLPALTQQQFNSKVAANDETSKGKRKKSKGPKNPPNAVNLSSTSSTPSATPSASQEATPSETQPETTPSDVPPTEKTEEEIVAEKIQNARRLTEEECIFCLHKSSNFDKNMEHMTNVHGLFIPDIEYLTDLRGLIKYLGEKVSVGNVCLYCNGKGRSFWSMEAVQSHMRDMNHCKILYDDNEDEYADYYDFSIDYADQPAEQTEEEAVNPSPRVRLSEDGSELVFTDGKSVGHRSLQVYYRQKVRPNETRDSLIISSLLSQYKQLGWTNTKTGKDGMDKKDLFIKYSKWKQARDFKIGVASNKLQKHFRKQIN